MSKPNKSLAILLAPGAMLMVAGVFLFVLRILPAAGCWMFLAGSIAYAVGQTSGGTEPASSQPAEALAQRRLRSIRHLSVLLLILAGISLCDTHYKILLPLFSNRPNGLLTYYNYIYNKWVLLLLIGALLQLYTTLRLSSSHGD